MCYALMRTLNIIVLHVDEDIKHNMLRVDEDIKHNVLRVDEDIKRKVLHVDEDIKHNMLRVDEDIKHNVLHVDEDIRHKVLHVDQFLNISRFKRVLQKHFLYNYSLNQYYICWTFTGMLYTSYFSLSFTTSHLILSPHLQRSPLQL